MVKYKLIIINLFYLIPRTEICSQEMYTLRSRIGGSWGVYKLNYWSSFSLLLENPMLILRSFLIFLELNKTSLINVSSYSFSYFSKAVTIFRSIFKGDGLLFPNIGVPESLCSATDLISSLFRNSSEAECSKKSMGNLCLIIFGFLGDRWDRSSGYLCRADSISFR